VTLNNLSATGTINVSGTSIVQGIEQSPNIIAQSITLSATGRSSYQGPVTFAQGSQGDTLTLSGSQSNFAIGSVIFISNALSSNNNGEFTVSAVSGSAGSGNTLILTLTQSYVLTAETDSSVTVGNGIIGQATNPIVLSSVPLLNASTVNGSIYLSAGAAVNSTAVAVIAGGGNSNVSLISSAQYLSIQNITAGTDGGTAAVVQNAGSILTDGVVLGGTDGLITGSTVSLTSPYNLGTSSMPLSVIATSRIVAIATATTRSSAGIYINNSSTSTLGSVNVATFDGNVTINNSALNSLLSFKNNTLTTPTAGPVVSFSNTYNSGGAFGNVVIGGAILARSIMAGIGSSGIDGTGQILMNAAGSITGAAMIGTTTVTPYPLMLAAGGGIGVTGAPIVLNGVSAVDASANSGNIVLTTILPGGTSSIRPIGKLVLSATCLKGDVSVNASQDLVLASQLTSTNGDVSVNASQDLVLASQLTSTNGTVFNSISSNGLVSLSTTGGISAINNSTISARSLNLTGGSIGSANTPLQTTSLGTMTLTATSKSGLYLSSNTALNVISATASGNSGNISLSSIGDMTLQGSVSGASTSLTAIGGSVTQNQLRPLISGLSGPNGVAVDGSGNVYVANSNANTVLMYNPTTQLVTTLNIPGLNCPLGVAVDTLGNLYVVNYNTWNVLKYVISSQAVTTLSIPNLIYPHGIAVDVTGNVYVANTGSNNIIKYDTSGATTTFLSGLNYPTSIAFDLAGNAYITNTNAYNVIQYNPSNPNPTVIVSGENVCPTGVAVDNLGNVYIADTYADAVLVYSPVTNSTSTLISNGLSNPGGVAVDGAGNVYVANTDDNNILKMAIPLITGTVSVSITAESIGSPTGVVQVNSTNIVAVGDYGGVYLSNQNSNPLTLSVASVGTSPLIAVPPSTTAPYSPTANTIVVYSAGNILLQQQSTSLTQLATSSPVAILNPGGVLTLVSGQTLNWSGTLVSGTAYGSITSLSSTASGTCSLNPYGMVSQVSGSAAVTVSGSGYLTAPQVTLSGGGGLGASATATINSLGQVTGITITTPGTGYTTAPTMTIAPPGDDIYTGTYTINGQTTVSGTSLAVLVIVSNTQEVIPPNPGGAPVFPALVTLADLTSSIYLAMLKNETNIAMANGTEVLNYTTQTVTITAEAITIESLGQFGGVGNATIPNGWSLILVATAGNIVFLNPGDTITTTTSASSLSVGAGTIIVTATSPGSVASLGNLTTGGGSIAITADGNIAIGSLTAGKSGLGAINVTSSAGFILFNNASNANLTGSPVTLTAGTQPVASGQGAALAQINALVVAAGANAAYSKAIAAEASAGATSAAELALVNALNSYLPIMRTNVTYDQTVYNSAKSTAAAQNNTVTTELGNVSHRANVVAGLEISAATLEGVGILFEIVGDLTLPVPVIGTKLSSGWWDLAGAINLAAYALSQAATVESRNLFEDIITAFEDLQTYTSDQQTASLAYSTWQANLATLKSFTVAANVATQAYASSKQAYANTVANTAQVLGQGQANTAVAIAGVIFASPSQPIGVSGATNFQLNSSDGPLNISSNITANSNINLNAGSYGSSTDTADNLTVSSGVSVRATGSSAVNLIAGNNVLIQSGSTIQAGGGSIVITANTDGNPNGATVTVAGTLTPPAGSIGLATIGVGPKAIGNEIFNITPSATTLITIDGGPSTGGANTLNFNAQGLAVVIGNNTITAGNLQPVTFTNIQNVVIINEIYNSLTLYGVKGVANTMSLVGSAKGAGTVTMKTATTNNIAYSFSNMASLTYLGGGAGDTLAVTPFSSKPSNAWDFAISLEGGAAIPGTPWAPAALTYNAPDPYSDVISTGNQLGNVVDPGVTTVAFSNVSQVSLVHQGISTLQILPSLTMSFAGGPYTGQAFTATSQVNGAASLGGITPKITYYYGTNLSPKFKLTSAPVNVGTYTAVVNYAGDYTYVNETIAASMTITQASQAINFSPLASNTVAIVPNKQITLKATGGNSGNPVIFTIDPASTPNAASISGNILTEYFPGTVIIDTNQLGSQNYTAAPQVQQTLVIAPGAASQVVIPQRSGTIAAGQVLPAITATIVDQYGNTVTSSTAIVTITATVGGKSVSFASGSTSVSAVGGLATFTGLSLTTAGLATLTVSSTGLTNGTSSSFTVTALAATNVVIPQTPSSVVAGKTYTVAARIVDQYGNTVTSSTASVAISAMVNGQPVNFATGSTTASAVNGVASFAGLSLTTAGTAMLTVTSTGLATGTSSGLVTAAAASQVAIPQTSQTFTAGQVVTAITARIADQYGNTVLSSTARVTITAIVNGIPANFATGTPSVSAVNGVATFNGLSLTKAGLATLTVSSGVLKSGASSSSVTSAAATKVVIPAAAGTFTAGKTYTITATVADQYGNPVTSSNASLTIAATIGGQAASFASGATTVAAVNGVATFSGMSLTTAGSATLTVSTGGLTSGVSSGVITAAAASQVVIPQSPASFTAGQTYTIKARIADLYGNTVTGSTARITMTAMVSGLAAKFASGNSSVAAVNGVATFNGMSLTTAGLATLTGSSGVLTSGSSSSSISPAAATKVLIQRAAGTFTAGQLYTINAAIADQYGNFVTSSTASITMTAAVANKPAGFASGVTTVAVVNGVATFSGLSLTVAGAATLTVSSPGLASGASSGTITAAAASQVVIPQTTQTANAGQVVPAIRARVADQYGNTVNSSTATVTIAAAIGGQPTSFASGTTIAAAVNGVATFNNLSLTTTGLATLTVSSGILTSGSSSSTVRPAAASQVILLPAAGSFTAGQAYTIAARIADRYGNTVTSSTASITITAKVGGIATKFASGTTIVSAVNGVATFNNLSLTTAGLATLTVSSGPLNSGTSSSSVTPAAASQVVIPKAAGPFKAGQAYTIAARIADPYGNTVTSSTASITIAATIGGQSANFATGVPTTAAVNGVATFTGLSLTTVGPATLTASSAALTSGTSSSTITPAAASQVVILPSAALTPGPFTAGQAYTIKARVADQYGNTVTSSTARVTIAAMVGGATANFTTGTTIASAVNGVATFTGLSLTTAGAATLTVRSTGLASGTSSGVITPAAATKVVILPAPASSAGPFTAGKTYTIAAMITDQYGNTVTSSTASATISATVSGKSASFASGVTTVAVVNGVATFTGLSLTTAGAVTLTVSSTGLVSGTSSSTVTPAAASQVIILPAPAITPGPFTAGKAYTISARIADQYGNTVTNSSASLIITAMVSGTPTNFASGTTTASTVNGVATFTGLSLTTAGAATLTVWSTGLASGTSSSTITPAAASQVMIQPLTGPFTAGGAYTISAVIADQYGNTVTNSTASVKIAATVGGNTASFASGITTVAAVNGVATFTNLSLTTAGNATLTVSSTGLASGTNSSTITPAAASQVIIPPAAGSYTAGQAYTISARIADQYGNTVTGSAASISISATVGGKSASFVSGNQSVPVVTVAVVNGVATFTGLSLTTAGNAILTVSSPGLTSGISSGTITPAAASQAVIPRPFGNFSVTAGQLLPLIPATIADQYGNTVTSNTAIVTITATVAGQPASFASGATTAQAVNGVATFTGLSLTTLGIATLTVSSGGLASGTSDSFTIVPA
jgi:hypothetical protein